MALALAPLLNLILQGENVYTVNALMRALSSTDYQRMAEDLADANKRLNLIEARRPLKRGRSSLQKAERNRGCLYADMYSRESASAEACG